MPALLAIINNIAPHVIDLSSQSSSKLMQLFATMASPAFVLANDSNYMLLHSLLEAINAIIEHQYDSKSPHPSCAGMLLMRSREHRVRLRNPESTQALLRTP